MYVYCPIFDFSNPTYIMAKLSLAYQTRHNPQTLMSPLLPFYVPFVNINGFSTQLHWKLQEQYTRQGFLLNTVIKIKIL